MSDRRPYIPVAVRVKVIRRMLEELPVTGARRDEILWVFNHLGSDSKRIEIGLSMLKLEDAQLDHDPALELRKRYRRGGRLFYSPPANSPDHLVYRRKGAHAEKTYGRKEGAERTVTTKGSDIWLIKKNRKKRHRHKQKIPSRPFPARSRPFGHWRTLKNNNNFGRRR